jgi:hypothetical protein
MSRGISLIALEGTPGRAHYGQSGDRPRSPRSFLVLLFSFDASPALSQGRSAGNRFRSVS